MPNQQPMSFFSPNLNVARSLCGWFLQSLSNSRRFFHFALAGSRPATTTTSMTRSRTATVEWFKWRWFNLLSREKTFSDPPAANRHTNSQSLDPSFSKKCKPFLLTKKKWQATLSSDDVCHFGLCKPLDLPQLDLQTMKPG